MTTNYKQAYHKLVEAYNSLYLTLLSLPNEVDESISKRELDQLIQTKLTNKELPQ